MCDTLIATSGTTKDGVAIFGKNSDREPNEAHQIVSLPAKDFGSGEHLHCTFIEIPQVAHTFAVLLAKPFWIWGAEMGINEHRLIIGNEALFTRVPYARKGLLGMDLLRLALERAETARAGINIITSLIAEFGQGGNHGLVHQSYYHNSYILADPQDAWVLETAGPHWAAKQIKGIYSISNGITIERDWDLASPELVSHAISQGWCRDEADFSFSRCYSDFLYTRFSDCRKRQARSREILTENLGKVTPEVMMTALRDHGQADGSQRSADESLSGADICMHAGFGPIRSSQTTGSMVSILDQDSPLNFLTGTAAPCTSIFKPVWLDAFSPDTSPSLFAILGPAPTSTYDPRTLFWRHEVLHRAMLRDHENLIKTFSADRDALEHEFIAEAINARGKNSIDRAEVTSSAFTKADAAEKEWLVRVQHGGSTQNWLHASAWKEFNREAGMPSIM
jgi:dipeptidase